MNETATSISRLSGQARVNAAVRAYLAGSICDEEALELGFPDSKQVNLLRTWWDCASWPESFSSDQRGAFGLMEGWALYDETFVSEDDEEFEEAFGSERLAAVLAGAEFTAMERSMVEERAGSTDRGTVSCVVDVLADDGSQLFAVYEIGDWGEIVSRSGPFTDWPDEEAISCDSVLVIELDQRRSWTPEYAERCLDLDRYNKSGLQN